MYEPIVGITTFITGDNLKLPTNYITAVSESGGVPLVLAKVESVSKIEQQVNAIDALILTGGDDIDASLFGEDPHQNLGNIEPGRDAFEMNLIKFTLMQDKPILAICRGAQILNIYAGGTMYQDIYTQLGTQVIQHTQNAPRDYLSHDIYITPGSKLESIIGNDKVKTNSFHHQSNKDISHEFSVSARSNDGIIEAIEHKDKDFVFGIQWHPEGSFKNDLISQKLFQSFIETANKR